MLSLATLIVSCGLTSGAPAGYVFGGFNSGYTWGWAGVGMDDLRAAIANPSNFGGAGVVPASAATVTIPSISARSLAGIDCFVAPANDDTQYSAAQINELVAWFKAGGDLLLMDDRDDFDAIGAALGFPTINGPGLGGGIHTATAVGNGPLVNGAFGTISTFSQVFLVGHLTERSVVAANGLVAATNSQGVALAYWPKGAFGPTSGKLVIVTDVDTFGDNNGYAGAADYVSMNSNAKLALNTVAFFVLTVDCPADLNSDGQVDAADLALLLGAWTSSGPADLNGDGSVSAADLAILLGAWGPCN